MGVLRSDSPAKGRCFFKIIVAHDVSEIIKLKIPETFARKYGKNLEDRVFLKDPRGAVWQVDLERTDNKVWLHKGLQEFAEHYSMCFGHFLVFQYEGDSHFRVLIFDTSATEIEYPSSLGHIEKSNLNEVSYVGKEIIEIDDCDESLEEFRACLPEMEKPRIPNLRPRKRARTNSTPEDVNGCKKEEALVRVNREVGTAKKSNQNYLQKIPSSHETSKGCRAATQRKLPGISSTDDGKRKGLKSAEHVSQRNPCFSVSFNPSRPYCLNVPKSFLIEHHIKLNQEIKMCDQNGTIWPLKCKKTKDGRMRISSGLYAFVKHNKLLTENYNLIFELADIGKEKKCEAFKVHIEKKSTNG